MLQALQDEMKARRNKLEQLCEAGRQLISDKHPRSPEIECRISSLQEQWNTLQELTALRRKQLEDAAEAYQVGGLARRCKVCYVWQLTAKGSM
jgi:spectrin beta